MENKNYVKVETMDAGYQIYLRIEIKIFSNHDFEDCYQRALLNKGSYTTLRGSGAPTIDRVLFSGKFAQTQTFPNNEYAIKEAKDFLNEFDSVLGVAYQLYDSLQKQRQIDAEEERKQKEKRQEEIDKLNKFFND